MPICKVKLCNSLDYERIFNPPRASADVHRASSHLVADASRVRVRASTTDTIDSPFASISRRRRRENARAAFVGADRPRCSSLSRSGLNRVNLLEIITQAYFQVVSALRHGETVVHRQSSPSLSRPLPSFSEPGRQKRPGR